MSNFKVFVGDNNNQAKYVGQIPDDVTIAKINNAVSLPDQTGNSGKFLTTDGTDTSWGDALVNESTNANSIGIGSPVYYNDSIVIGKNSEVSANGYSAVVVGKSSKTWRYGVSIGFDSIVTKIGGIALGASSNVTGNYAIQFNTSTWPVTNSDANTFKVANANGNFEIMSADGTIPEARLANMTNATTGQVLQLDSNNNANWSTISEVASQSSGTIKFWTGTQTQYDAITTKDATTLYIVIPAS